MKFYTSAVESGNEILLRGYENGRAFARKVKYEPTLYVPTTEPGPWRTMHGKQLGAIIPGSIRDCKDMIKQYRDVSGFEIYGFDRFVYAFLNEEYPGEISYDQDLIRIGNIDIEVASENVWPKPESATEEVTAITYKIDGVFHCFGTGAYVSHRPDVKYIRARSERELLLAFLNTWSSNYPDVITGWNINFFDIPYLINRITLVFGDKEAKRLSPWKYFQSRSVTIMGREQTSMSISGIQSLDYMELYKKFTYKQQDSYKLDNIAYVELDERKIDYSEYDSLHQLYKSDFQKFMEYNIKDVDLVDKLEDKLKLIEMVYALAFDAKVNFMDSFSQVRMWDVMIHNYLYEHHIAIPTAGNTNHKYGAYEGAYVKDPKLGMHEWVMSFDLNSLYPHLIMQYNISPEKIGPYSQVPLTINQLLDKSYNPPLKPSWSLAPNGYYFSCGGQGFLPAMMQLGYDKRVEYKKKQLQAERDYEVEQSPLRRAELKKLIAQYKNKQMAKKIQLNSAYGAVGNEYFRFYDIRQATAITMGGQLSIRWAEQEINDYMNEICQSAGVDYIIASDTDSLYINFEPLVSRIFKDTSNRERIINTLAKIAKEKIEPKLDEIYQSLCERMGAFAQKMKMTREVIADRGIWTAKKRYILNVWDSEDVRYKEPKLKIMGLEAVKSSTPESCRIAIKVAMKLMIAGDEDALQAYIEEFRKKFKTLPFEDVAFPRGVQGLNSYTLESKALPIHVRGALTFNQALLNMKLTKRYEVIREGDKVKFCYLKMPNKFHSNIFAITSILPKEFGISSLIDYDVQFEKAFLQPIRAILDVIGWTDTKVNTLEGFFQ